MYLWDYDVDGTARTALWAQPVGAQTIFHPHRMIDGYGLSLSSPDGRKAPA